MFLLLRYQQMNLTTLPTRHPNMGSFISFTSLVTGCPSQYAYWFMPWALDSRLCPLRTGSVGQIYMSLQKVGSHKEWIDTWRKLRNGTDLARKIEVEISMKGKLQLVGTCPPSLLKVGRTGNTRMLHILSRPAVWKDSSLVSKFIAGSWTQWPSLRPPFFPLS